MSTLRQVISAASALVTVFLFVKCVEAMVDNIIEFPHDSCQHDIGLGFEFTKFRAADSYYDSDGNFKLLVRFKGTGDGHIALTEKHYYTNASEPLYVIFIGSFYNTITEIRRTTAATAKHRISTPGILSTEQWRGFLIEYNVHNGKLAVYPEGISVPLVQFSDPNPLNITHFSFKTWYHQTMDVAFDCRPTDAYSSLPLVSEGDEAPGNISLSTKNTVFPSERFPISGGIEIPTPAPRKRNDQKVKGPGKTISELRTKLLDGYETKTPPNAGEGVPTKVGIGMTLNYFTLEDSEHVFLVNSWIRMTWTDNRLSYDSALTNGTNMHYGDADIWHPDLTLYNNAYPTEVDHYGDTHSLVSPDGTVLWVPPARLAAHCSLNFIRWPHDTHTCELKFGSWTHHGDEIDLHFINYANETSDMMIEHASLVKNSEWKLLKSSAVRNEIYYPCCPEPYVDITFSFTFTRISPSYAITFILPIIFIALVNMLVFLLPPASGEKILLCGLNFTIVCMFLLYLQAKVPPFGDHLPLLVLLYGCNLVLISISLAISVIVLNLSRTRRVSSPHQCTKIFCNIHFATALGLGHLVPFVSQTHSRLAEEGVEMRYREGNHHGGRAMNGDLKDDQTTNLVDYEIPTLVNADWILLASMIDRLSFIMYAVVNGVTLGICLS